MFFSEETNNKNSGAVNHDIETSEQGSSVDNKKSELETCRAALAQSSEKYIYLAAEFENFKRRTERDKTQWMQSAQSTLIVDLLPIIDDFERALAEQQAKQIPAEYAAYFSGYELIARELQKFLKKHEIQEISQLGQFDPNKHEAIMQVQSEKHASGDVVAILQKGYMHKNQVLRPARVSVAE